MKCIMLLGSIQAIFIVQIHKNGRITHKYVLDHCQPHPNEQGRESQTSTIGYLNKENPRSDPGDEDEIRHGAANVRKILIPSRAAISGGED